VALFVIDARAGLTPLDEEIARYLREQDVPVILVANKAEGSSGDAGFYEAFGLGMGEPIAFSAEHGVGMADLFEALLRISNARGRRVRAFDLEDEEALNAAPLKLAIVGRPNAGKSTLINAFLGEDRLLTGPEAGITRDSIAVDWKWTDRKTGEERPVRLIDTAGMRKKALVVELERGPWPTRRAIDFAEVVVLLLDATRGLEHQDLKIASMVLEEGRALMIAINKWDVAEDASGLFNGIKAALDDGLAQVRGLPLMAVSARTARARSDAERRVRIARGVEPRVPTAALNRWFDDALAANPPPAPVASGSSCAISPGQDPSAQLRAVRYAPG
jgi:GTP-binding protein